MFHNIVVPVDLAHSESLGKALSVSADLATHSGSTVVGHAEVSARAVPGSPVPHQTKPGASARCEQQGGRA